jgi:hypothetical protein
VRIIARSRSLVGPRPRRLLGDPLDALGGQVVRAIAAGLAKGEVGAQGGELAVDRGGLAVGRADEPVAELADVGRGDRLRGKAGLGRDVLGEPAGEADQVEPVAGERMPRRIPRGERV